MAASSEITPIYQFIDQHTFKYVLRCGDEKQNAEFNFKLGKVNSDNLFSNDRWTVDRLEKCRIKLNHCKAQVGQFSLHEWDKHTETTEISSNIKKLILQRFANKPPVLTRAWIKFYDIISSFPLFASSDDCTIRFMFLCEAPGGFVNATNHYIRANHTDTNFNWLATSLNPYYEQIDLNCLIFDDRFISDSYYFSNWFFASTNTGDILDDRFSDDLKFHLTVDKNLTSIDNFGVFDCVTGDGAFNCLNDPERQEEMVFKLILQEVVVATRFLKANGSMVIKFFTFFSCETISLLYYICNCFEDVVCYKPVASKHGNSEIYLVCLKFNRCEYNRLLPHFVNVPSEKFILNRDLIPQNFIDRICTLCQDISTRQTDAINRNVKLFGKITPDLLKSITRNKYKLANMFVQKFNLFSIPVSEQLIFENRNQMVFCKKIFKIFCDYQNHKSKTNFCKSLQKLFALLQFDEKSLNSSYVLSASRTVPKLHFIYGTVYENINNSKFCCPYMLRAFNIVTSYLNFATFSTTSPTSSFVNCVENILGEKCLNGNNKFVFYQQSAFSNYLGKQIDIEICDVSRQPIWPQQMQPIHFIDLYDSINSITSNDFETCLSLRNTFARLVKNDHMKASHICMIRVKSLLSRLVISLFHLLTKFFRKITLLRVRTPVDSTTPSLLVVLDHFCEIPSHLYEEIFDEKSTKLWTKQLLCFVPVPEIIANQNFYNALFEINSSTLLLCIKYQLENCVKY